MTDLSFWLSFVTWTFVPINVAVCTTIAVAHIKSWRENRITRQMIMDMNMMVELHEGATVISVRTLRPEDYLLHDTETGQVWRWETDRNGWVDSGRRAMKGS